MKQTSTAFKALAENPYGARYHIRISDNGTDITQDIDNYKYEHIVNDDDVFLFGNTASALVTFSITEPTVNLHGKEITIYQGINVNGTIQEIKQGIFKVLKPKKTRDKTEYQAIDRMTYLLNTPYFSELTYPTTDIAILNEICGQCGIVLANSSLVSHSIGKILNGYTKREIVAYISQLQGKNAIINSDGNLELIWYNEVNYIIDDNKIYYDGTSDVNSETNYTLGYIECTVRNEDGSEEKTLRTGDGITGVRISNPLMTQEILEEVFNAIGGFSFMPAEFEFLGDFRLEVGDIVTVETNNTTYKVPIMQLTHKSDGGVVTTVASIAETDSENEIDMTSPAIKEMDRYYANLVLINQALIGKLSADEADIRYVQTEQLDAVEANVTNAVIGNLSTNFADIHLANIDVADVGLLFNKVGLIDRATIVDGHITGYLDAVEINANKITAGTLIADRILLSGGNKGVLYALNNLGELTSTNVNSLDGYVLTDRTITADKIIAKSITTNELDVNQIFGNTAVLNMLFASDIFANAIATNTIIVGKADISEIITENLLPYPYKDTTKTVNGITFTDLGDGSIRINGTATADSIFLLSPVYLKAGTYTLSVSDSGFNTNYCNFQLSNSENNIWWGFKAEVSSNGTRTYTLEQDLLFNYNRLLVKSGHTMNNVIWKPMVEVGSVAHSYQPYARSREGIIEQIIVDNLLIYPYFNTTKTTKGITYTDNGDGTINVSGKPTESNNFICRSRLSSADSHQLILPAGTYTVSGCPEGGSLDTYYIQCGTSDDSGNWKSLGNDYGNGVTFTVVEDTAFQLLIIIDVDCPQINVTFKPMLEVGTIPHPYHEYVKSGTGLINNINSIKIGGKNLILKSYLMKYGGTLVTDNFVSSGEVIQSDDVANGGFKFDSINCYEPNTEYTLSGYVSLVSGIIENFYLHNGKSHIYKSFYIDGKEYGNPLGVLMEDANELLNDGQPHYFELHFTTASSIKNDTSIYYTYFQINKESTTFVEYKIKGFKLEKGNKATDWTPAPEDVEINVETANTNANTAISNSNTAINTANSANTNANTAITTANTAITTADTANTNATSAMNTANTASTNATNALNRATYHYGTCTTAAGTVSGFELYTGAQVTVQFTNANTATNPTLNVNGTGAKNIRVNNANISAKYYWKANNTVTFVYNGTYWVMSDTSANTIIANWCSSNDVTYIDGGKIYTGSITADKINVTDLFSQSITATGSITGAKLYGAYAEIEGGKIGGFTLSENRLVATNSDGNEVVIDPKGDDERACSIYVYSSVDGKPYGIDKAGKVIARGMDVFGVSSFSAACDFQSRIRVSGAATFLDTVTAPKFQFGTNYNYYLDKTGKIYANNVVIPNNCAYYCRNSSGTDVSVVQMASNDVLRFGLGASKIRVGDSGVTSELKLYGEVRTNHNIVIPNNQALLFNNSSGTAINSLHMGPNNVLYLGKEASKIIIGKALPGTAFDCGIVFTYASDNSKLNIIPANVSNYATYLGDATYYYNTIYYATLSQQSDRNVKKDVYNISKKYLDMWDMLQVKTFRYKEDDKTVRVGLIAQDVEECAYKVGLTNEECGFIIKDYVDNENYKGYRYSLDYTGIATITMAKLKQVVDVINTLQDEIAILKATILHLQQK